MLNNPMGQQGCELLLMGRRLDLEQRQAVQAANVDF